MEQLGRVHPVSLWVRGTSGGLLGKDGVQTWITEAGGNTEVGLLWA